MSKEEKKKKITVFICLRKVLVNKMKENVAQRVGLSKRGKKYF